jgi:hypothetical protein
MNDWNEWQAGDSDTTTATRTERRARRFPDPFALVVGLVTLLVAAYTLSDGAIDLPAADPRWYIAGGALFVGLMLLGASIRPRRDRDR